MKSNLKHQVGLLDRNQVCYFISVSLPPCGSNIHRFKNISVTARSLLCHCSPGHVVNDRSHDRPSLVNGLPLFLLPPFIYQRMFYHASNRINEPKNCRKEYLQQCNTSASIFCSQTCSLTDPRQPNSSQVWFDDTTSYTSRPVHMQTLQVPL